MNEVENEISGFTNLATANTLNAKRNKAKTKTCNITNLSTTTAIAAAGNRIHDHSKYITTPEFNKLTEEDFGAKLAKEKLVNKSDIATFVKMTDFDKHLI